MLTFSSPPSTFPQSPSHPWYSTLSGEVPNFQDVVRGEINAETITAQTSTFTLHSTTKYLFTSIQTYLTSVITPVVTSTLKTNTLFTNTVFTRTETLTTFRAARITKTKHFTATKTIPSKMIKTIHPTVTPSVSLKTTISTRHPRTTITSTIKSETSIAKETSIKLKTSTILKTLKPTTRSVATPVARNELLEAPDRRKVDTTTTNTDFTAIHVATDFRNTATDELSSTTTLIDYTGVALATLSSTSTVFDPHGTQITSGIFSGISTRVLQSWVLYVRRASVAGLRQS